MKNWFITWFNTPYYHLLYKNRNQSEAEHFIQHLLQQLKPSEEAIFLDVACGKGRHSKFIHKNGYYINGIDLSSGVEESKGLKSNTKINDLFKKFYDN